MRPMKDSGVVWIGEIPNDWEVRKLSEISDRITDFVASGSFADLRNNVTYLDEPNYAMLVRTADLSGRNNVSHIYIDKKTYDFLSNSNLHGGEIILPNIGSVGDVYFYQPIYQKASLAPNSIMIEMKDNNRFFYYWFLNPVVNGALKMIGSDSVQAKFNKTQLRAFRVARPKENEQSKIASYLDHKVALINDIIEKTKQSIEEYKKLKQSIITEVVTKGLNPDVKMKDSGIEWIVEIPEHWSIVPIVCMFDFCKGLGITKDDLTLEGYKVVNYGQIHSKINVSFMIDENLVRFISEDNKNINSNAKVGIGDFIFADTSEDLDGTGNFVMNDKSEVIYAGYHTIVLKSKYRNFVLSKFISFQLMSDAWRAQLRSQVSGIKLFSITQKILKSTKIILPHINEIEQINNNIEARIKTLNTVIDRKNSLIIDLESYKKSLIYEVVTGKKEIT